MENSFDLAHANFTHKGTFGRIDDPTKRWLLRKAAVLAYPSLDEGFGFPLLDAMQAGVPIVAARRGSIPEVAGEAALLVDPLDTDDLAAALTAAVDDQALRARLLTAAGAQLARFSWERTAGELTDIYRALAGARSGGTR